MNTEMLHCAGCGVVVCERPKEGEVLAISCRCDAYSPILVTAGMLQALEPVWETIPTSLTAVSSTSGHWENYLGPNPRTNVGKAWKTYLEERGLTSMADCQKESCKREVERQRKKSESGHQGTG